MKASASSEKLGDEDVTGWRFAVERHEFREVTLSAALALVKVKARRKSVVVTAREQVRMAIAFYPIDVGWGLLSWFEGGLIYMISLR